MRRLLQMVSRRRNLCFAFLISLAHLFDARAFRLLSTSRWFGHRSAPSFSFDKVATKLHSLVPEKNPVADELQDAKSLSGVRYGSVFEAMNDVYPPTALEQRTALSRRDGYWPFVQDGKEPPQQFTYGEFDFYFFAQLLDRAHAIYFEGMDDPPDDWRGSVFTDIGSGTGRLVFSAAALHPGWRKCRGVELLQSIHKAAQDHLERCRVDGDSYALPPVVNEETGDSERLAIAPVEFECGSFEDPTVYFADSDLIFVFSSCMSGVLLQELAESIGRQCKPGTLVITTDYMLPLDGEIEADERDPSVPHGPFRLKLLEKVDGWCWLTGGASTAFIQRVEQSLWTKERADKPREISLEDKVYKMVVELEEDRDERYQRFLVGIYNDMMFNTRF